MKSRCNRDRHMQSIKCARNFNPKKCRYTGDSNILCKMCFEFEFEHFILHDFHCCVNIKFKENMTWLNNMLNVISCFTTAYIQASLA